MARFEYYENGRTYVTLKAEVGEDIPVEMAQAWATLRIAGALDYAADKLHELVNAVEGLK